MSWGNDQQNARDRDIAARKLLRGESARAELANIANREAEDRKNREQELRAEQLAAERRMNAAADRREKEREAREEARFKEEQYERKREREREQDRRDEAARLAYIEEMNEQAVDDFVDEADSFMMGVKGNTSKYLPDHGDLGYLLHLWHWAIDLFKRLEKMELTPDAEYVGEFLAAWEDLVAALSRQGIEDPATVFTSTRDLLDNSWYVAYRKEFLEQNPFELPIGDIDAGTYQQGLEAFEAVIEGIDECAAEIRKLVDSLGPKYVYQTKKGEWMWTERFRAHNNYMFFAPGVEITHADQFQEHDRGRYFSDFAFCMDAEHVAEYLKPYRAHLVEARQAFEAEKKAQLELLETHQKKPALALAELEARPARFSDSPVWAELRKETQDAKILENAYLSILSAVVVGLVTFVAGYFFDSQIFMYLSILAFVAATVSGVYIGIKSWKYNSQRGARAHQAFRAWVDKLSARGE